MRNYLIILFLGYFSLGVAIPAMALIITSKGYSLKELSVAMLCFSASVMVLEVPSGIFCDAQGRRKGYLVGMATTLVGTLLLLSRNLTFLIIGFAFNGVGRAFSSGSLDALLIDSHLKENRSLDEVMVAMEIVSSLALTCGSLFGGILLAFGKSGVHLTDSLLIVRGTLILLGMVLVWLLISNDSAGIGTKKNTFIEQVRQFLATVKDNRFLQVYVLFSLVHGGQLFSMESYWQPFLQQLLHSEAQIWMLGVVGGSVFVISILGSLVGKRLMKWGKSSIIFLVAILCAFFLEALFLFVKTPLQFVVVYFGIYLVLGVVSVLGGVLLNLSISSEVRSSVLSINSLALQGGGMLANLLAIVLLAFFPVTIFWVAIAILGFTSTLSFSRVLLKAAPSTSPHQNT
ncbi:MAG: MFS transporter [Sphaerochaetaceae bacterium]|nr:MFS transporter [Sphaerochaetaceae bacterium]